MQLLIVAVPGNGWSRITLYTALQLDIVVQCLGNLWTWHRYLWWEFYIKIGTTTIGSDAIVGYAVINSSVFLFHFVEGQNVATEIETKFYQL